MLEAAAEEYVPAAQLVHVDWPVLFTYEPAGHSTHAERPAFTVYVPVGQTMQVAKAVAAEAVEYLPRSQSVQLLAEGKPEPVP